mmetsp:Transcript_6421/g.13879  ORF Transcript_6421/g.13879 Transcript_6421/m.13879 type:complete len:208 (-) Transcript_6421:261-884(-)
MTTSSNSRRKITRIFMTITRIFTTILCHYFTTKTKWKPRCTRNGATTSRTTASRWPTLETARPAATRSRCPAPAPAWCARTSRRPTRSRTTTAGGIGRCRPENCAISRNAPTLPLRFPPTRTPARTATSSAPSGPARGSATSIPTTCGPTAGNPAAPVSPRRRRGRRQSARKRFTMSRWSTASDTGCTCRDSRRIVGGTRRRGYGGT